MIDEDYEELVADACLAHRPLWSLSDLHRAQLLSALRRNILDSMGVGGDRHEVLRRAKGNCRQGMTVAKAIDSFGRANFDKLAAWMFKRLEGQRESVE